MKSIPMKKSSEARTSILDFAGHVERLVKKGLYTPVLTEKYSKEDLTILGNLIEPETGQAIYIYRIENIYGPLCCG